MIKKYNKRDGGPGYSKLFDLFAETEEIRKREEEIRKREEEIRKREEVVIEIEREEEMIEVERLGREKREKKNVKKLLKKRDLFHQKTKI